MSYRTHVILGLPQSANAKRLHPESKSSEVFYPLDYPSIAYSVLGCLHQAVLESLSIALFQGLSWQMRWAIAIGNVAENGMVPVVAPGQEGQHGDTTRTNFIP
ncbi:MAG: hypothetical protein F6K30_10895 [Cyanothece sp. SIO2G6]|nr:hypothetical protein [Cyanothece sp. SIO2G6]